MYYVLDENKTVTQVINKVSNDQIEERLENVLDKVKKVDETCDFKGCKQKTNLMGQTCQFCNHRFCYKHNLPETHSKLTNCAELVRKKEREEFLHPKVDTRSIQKRQEHDKNKKTLEQRLKQMQLERKAKLPGAGTSNKKKK